MAWRDSRSHRLRLLLYSLSIVLGVAALVSIRSFSANLREGLEEQSKSLLGADLVFSSPLPLTPEVEELIRPFARERAYQTSFSSMALFPEREGTRLVQVRALEGEFPFYGELETDPALAAKGFRNGAFALLDQTLMLQFDLVPGDRIQLGHKTFEILGSLLSVPGDSPTFNALGSRIYIPERFVGETGLIQIGSRVRYAVFVRTDAAFDPATFLEENRERISGMDLRAETVQSRKEQLGRAMENLDRFLSLVGLIALLLGGIGVATSIHLYTREKIPVIATLRCIGATAKQSFSIYLLQAAGLGALGSTLGGLLGVAIQETLPAVFSGLIPFKVETGIAWSAVAQGFWLGLAASVLFALIPLLPLRGISPLLALRSEYQEHDLPRRDWAVRLVYAAIGAFILSFALLNTESIGVGVGFFVGLLAVFAALYGAAALLIRLVRRFFPSRWAYEWRQGLANLYRPHNQTAVLMFAIGLGTFFLLSIYLVQSSLLQEIDRFGGPGKPNLILFDIQSNQTEPVAELVRAQGLPVLDMVPIVTMRLEAIGDVPRQDVLAHREAGRPEWALRREYRSTYRDVLDSTERIVRGRFPGDPESERIPVSLEDGIARELQVDLGDRLTFDVQGIQVEAEVASIRAVDWQNFQTNFFVVFPNGVLESAPQFHVLITRTETLEASAQLQREVVRNFPNISAVDLTLILESIESVLSKVSFVLQFLGAFTLLTGVIVLLGALASGRYQRARESALLRTMGGSRPQIWKILAAEYFFLGAFAVAVSFLLALVAGGALSIYLFESPVPHPGWIAPAFALGVVALVVLVGLFNSRRILEAPPLQILRAEN